MTRHHARPATLAFTVALALGTIATTTSAAAPEAGQSYQVSWNVPALGTTVTGKLYPWFGYEASGYLVSGAPSKQTQVAVDLLVGGNWVQQMQFAAGESQRIWFASQVFGTESFYPDTVVIGAGGPKHVRFRVIETGQTSPTLTIVQPSAAHVPAVSSKTPLRSTYAYGKPTSMWIEGANGPVVLQRWTGKAWVEAGALPYTHKGDENRRYISLEIPPKEAIARAGTSVTYRISSIGYSNEGVTDWNSTPQKVTFPKVSSSIDYQEIARLTPLAISSTDGTTVGVYLSERIGTNAPAGRKAYLQRKSGKNWVNVSSGTNKQGGVVKVPVPKYASASRKDTYRVHVPATRWSQAVTSKPITMRVDNPTKYTGYRKQMREAMKKYCPTATITQVPRTTFSGRAHLGYNAIEVIGGFRGANLKQVALHECAHLLQWQTWVKANQKNRSYDWSDYKNRLNKIYGTRGNAGIEANADCAAVAMGASIKAGPRYTTNCKGARGKAGTATKNLRTP